MNITDQNIVSICELLQAMDRMLEIPHKLLKYYRGLMLLQYHRSRSTVISTKFATSLINETIERVENDNDLKSTFNAEAMYWNLITFGFVKNLAEEIDKIISIQVIAAIIYQYILAPGTEMETKEEAALADYQPRRYRRKLRQQTSKSRASREAPDNDLQATLYNITPWPFAIQPANQSSDSSQPQQKPEVKVEASTHGGCGDDKDLYRTDEYVEFDGVR